MTKDQNFKIIDFNEVQLQYLGMSRDEIQYEFVEDVFPKEVANSVIKHYRNCLKNKKQINYEEDVVLPGRGHRQYLTTLSPIKNETGEIYRLIGSSIEITDRKKTEKALIKSEEKYRSFVENSSEGIYLFEFSKPVKTSLPVTKQIEHFYKYGFISSCNDALAQMYGYETGEDLVGKTLVDFHGSDDDPAHYDFLRNFIESGYRSKNELTSDLDKEGNTKYFLENNRGIVNNGELIRVWASQRDVTEQIKAEQKLRESEERFRKLANNVPGVIYLCKNDERYTMDYINNQVEELTGYSSEAFMNDNISFTELYHPDDVKTIYKKVESALEERRAFQLTYRIKHRDKSWRWVLENGVGIYNKNNELIHLEGYITDITEQKQAEEIAYQASQQMQFHIENSPLAVINSDENFEFTQWSKSAEELFGWNENEVSDKNPIDWKFVHEEDQEEVQEKINELLEGRKARNVCRNRNYTKNGNILHCEWYNSAMFDQDGKVISIFSLVHDISERKEKEKAIKESLAEKETLLSEIHHRVKNNLAVVSGMMQLQAYEAMNEELQNKLFDSVIRIKTMASVHELLYQSKSFSKLDFSDTIINLVENISETLRSTVPVHHDIDSAHIKLDINKAIPASLIVNEVITNIYKHAFKNHQEGNIKFRATENNDIIKITIQDNGIGIKKDRIREAGSLGMILIRELANQIDGDYEYGNVQGQGTLFSISFPKKSIS